MVTFGALTRAQQAKPAPHHFESNGAGRLLKAGGRQAPGCTAATVILNLALSPNVTDQTEPAPTAVLSQTSSIIPCTL